LKLCGGLGIGKTGEAAQPAGPGAVGGQSVVVEDAIHGRVPLK